MTRWLGSFALTMAVVALVAAQAPPPRFGFGDPAPRDLIATLDIDVRPDGTGLPPGRGTAGEGGEIYARQCAACHGPKGEGGQAERLVGGEPKGFAPFGPEYERWRDGRPDVPFTIGNYWPYATTLFDYIRRAMPPGAPGYPHRQRDLRRRRLAPDAKRHHRGQRGDERRDIAPRDHAGAQAVRARRSGRRIGSEVVRWQAVTRVRFQLKVA